MFFKFYFASIGFSRVEEKKETHGGFLGRRPAFWNARLSPYARDGKAGDSFFSQSRSLVDGRKECIYTQLSNKTTCLFKNSDKVSKCKTGKALQSKGEPKSRRKANRKKKKKREKIRKENIRAFKRRIA